MLPNNKKCYKKTLISAFFGSFLTKKQPKLTKNEENLQNPNRLMKFSEIWHVDASQEKKNATKKLFLISAFFGLFWPKNSKNWQKMTKNCQNQNRLIKFSEIWYVDSSQQKKMLQKNIFWFWHFLAFLLAKKQPKLIIKNEENCQIYNITIEVFCFT